MNEAEIRQMVESRRVEVDASVSWFTPSGNRRTSPLYEGDVVNAYLKKRKTVKARSMEEFEFKVNQTVATWAKQEIRKRVVDAKRDAKEQAQAEAERRDAEAKDQLQSLSSILAATLQVDDRLDWDAERDTRSFPRFSFPHAPKEPVHPKLTLPPKPRLTWLLRGRLRRWEAACQNATRSHAASVQCARDEWQESVRQHEAAREAARQQHTASKEEFLAEQQRFNRALADFRTRFEAGNSEAIIEYCSQVLERSQYPDCIRLENKLSFDVDAGIVVVDLDLPSADDVPTTSGYKFVSRGNRVEPIYLKKKDASTLHQSVVDQIVLRTIHEILEGCYVSTVTGVLLNGWITSLDKATGNDKRERACCVVADRETFESFDLSRIDPAACIQRLSDQVNQMHGASR